MTVAERDKPSVAITVEYTISGAVSGSAGVPSANITITPSGSVTSDTVSYSDGGQGGTFTPPSPLTWSNSSAGQSITYTAASPGPKQLTFTSANSLPITNSPWVFVVSQSFSPGQLILSWRDRESMTPNIYQLRERYIATKDPLPNMNFVQLQEALPDNYDLPLGEEPGEGDEVPPEELSEEQAPLAGEVSSVEGEQPGGYIFLTPVTGSVGNEISIDATYDLPEIVDVQLNDEPVDFIPVTPTTLVFEVPVGAVSGLVKLITSDGTVIEVGDLTIIG